MWFTDADVEGAAEYWSKLKYLNLHGCRGVKDLSCHILGSTCHELLSLNLDFCDITDVGLDYLRKSQAKVSLCELSLTGCARLTQASVQVLTSHNNMRHLCLARCTKLYAPVIFDQLAQSYPSLHMLNLTFLNIDDDGIALLCKRLSHLQHLVLSFCKFVTDISMKHIGSTLASQSLKVMDISNTSRIGDIGLQLLVAHCTKQHVLKRLIVTSAGPALTEKGVTYVRQGLPSCVVLFSK